MLNPKFFLRSCFLLLFFPLCFCGDSITYLKPILDSREDTLVSEGGRFELGFFTPSGSSDPSRYIGIWYSGSRPRTVVWVANRDAPLHDRTGSFGFAEDGNVVVTSEGKGPEHSWSSGPPGSSSSSRKAQLMDSGNLVVSELSQGGRPKIKWQSFDYPTDTFLPGMLLGSLSLSSWKGADDPGVGNFTFQKDQESEGQYVMNNQQFRYWKSGIYGKFVPSDDLPPAIFLLLTRNTSLPPSPRSKGGWNIYSDQTPRDYNNTMLRITFDGVLQYLTRDNETSQWSIQWHEPRDQCGMLHFCGNFGSCNSLDIVPCKCLPGFAPQHPDLWRTGDFSKGCTSKSSYGDTFVNFTMMKASKPSGDGDYAKNETECMDRCLSIPKCQAYSYIIDQSIQRGTGQGRCWRWFEELEDIQENAEDGAKLSVRVSLRDIEPLQRSCKPCGTNIIPYPLSTGDDCGDPEYSFFTCDNSTGRLYFQASNDTYRVTRVDEATYNFTIQLNKPTYCASGSSAINLAPSQSSQFFIRSCSRSLDNLSSGAPATSERSTQVEIGWNLPKLEPPCNSSIDCLDWPQTTCDATGSQTKRCLCNSNLIWNSTVLNCTGGQVGANFGQTVGGGASSHGTKPLYLLSLVAIPIIIAAAGFFYIKRRKSTDKQVKRADLAGRLYDSERRVKEWISSGQFGDDDKKDIDVPFFDLDVILEATGNFSDENKLGRGGFGPVYKGTFPGGQEIAVKRLLSASGQGLEEFKNEVMLIAKLQHRNLVRLLGYCVEREEKMLLYEYMPNKSLDSFLFDRTRCMLLTWEMRLDIILGIARGMLYLHQDSRLRIIHRDLKASNVLLDEEMNPKISDFGLARIFEGKQTEASTQRVIGTYGYMSPEYALDGFFSFKSDVFSFGIVVLEIISGKRNTGIYLPEGQLNILSHAWRLWAENNAMNLVDSILEESCNKHEVFKCINVALLCVQDDPNDRPTMSNVLFMLAGEITTLPTPKKPAFALKPSLSSTGSSSTKPNSSITIPATMEHGR